VVEPYHYTKKTVNISASVDLVFRLTDRAGTLVGQSFEVTKSNHPSAILIQDVKPEDAQGVTNQGVDPDENQFLTQLEIDARNAVVSAIREKASQLPAKILQDARAQAQAGDSDGAAELYILFLNSTGHMSTPERDEALKFLHERFNLTPPVSSKA